MRAWDFIDHEGMPDGSGTLYLVNRGTEYAIHVDGCELMSNREHGSEDALADFACDRLAQLEGPEVRVLVGGLGMGFTLAAVLRRIGADASATVAELVPAVIRWNREFVGRAAKHPLRDPRVAIHVGDVGDLIEKPPALWSSILLDVDNGPEALSRSYNGWLYTPHGLQSAYDALIPGGVLGIWSAADSPMLTDRLTTQGFEVEVLPYFEAERLTHDDLGTHVTWMARRPL